MDVPGWCLNKLSSLQEKHSKVKLSGKDLAFYNDNLSYFTKSCNDGPNDTFTNSNFIKLDRIITIPLEIFCLTILLGFTYFRKKYNYLNYESKINWRIQCVLT